MVEVVGAGKEEGGFQVRRVGGEEIFDKVRPDQLSIERGRRADEPLMRLLDKHGFDPQPYIQPEEFRTPASRSGSASSGLRRDGAGRDNLMGFRPAREGTPAPGFARLRPGLGHGNQNLGKEASRWAQRRGFSPYGQLDPEQFGGRRQSPFTPAAGTISSSIQWGAAALPEPPFEQFGEGPQMGRRGQRQVGEPYGADQGFVQQGFAQGYEPF
jgi:hypothetical protein